MTSQLGRLEIASFCGSCGFVKAVPIMGRSNDRCTECGRFCSTDPDVCCTEHEVRSSPYSTGECPYCEQERDRRAQQMHQMTRDPTLEPY